jgi:SAM-dependent methyltransferase
MSSGGIILRRLLDPRPEDEADACPIADAVNIPLEALGERVHELPPRAEVVRVADCGASATRAVSWLRSHGRTAVLESRFDRGAAPAGALGGRLWRPNAFLEEVAARLRPGTALDLGCGAGRDAVFLAASGWKVTAVDVLPDALALGAALAGRYTGVSQRIRWVACDLRRGAGESDGSFELVFGFRFLDRALLRLCGGWLVAGGSLVWETFTTVHRDRHGKPARAADVLRPGELRRLVEGLLIEHESEDWRGEAHTARVWARRVTG